MYNRRERNEDLGESSKGLIVFSQTARPTGGRRNDGNLSRALLDTAHWYLSIYIYKTEAFGAPIIFHISIYLFIF